MSKHLQPTNMAQILFKTMKRRFERPIKLKNKTLDITELCNIEQGLNPPCATYQQICQDNARVKKRELVRLFLVLAHPATLHSRQGALGILPDVTYTFKVLFRGNLNSNNHIVGNTDLKPWNLIFEYVAILSHTGVVNTTFGLTGYYP